MAATFPRGAARALLTVTRPSKGLFLLSMHNAPDNRLTPVRLFALESYSTVWRVLTPYRAEGLHQALGTPDAVAGPSLGTDGLRLTL